MELEAADRGDAVRDHVTRRALPIEQSIVWKPLRDPHYVVASLQPSDGGRRKIVIRQLVLARIAALVGIHGRRTFGLLIGQLYECPETRIDYLVIESMAEQMPAADDTEMAAVLTEAYARAAEQRLHVMGWFRGVSTMEPKLSSGLGFAATHMSLLDKPWQTSLVVAEGTQATGGAFFLYDNVNARWFCAPFHELLDHSGPNAPKPTFVNWPQQYITTDFVVPAEPLPALKLEVADARPKPRHDPPSLWGKAKKDEVRVEAVAPERVDFVAPPPEQPAPETSAAQTNVGDRPVLSDRPVPRQTHPGLADVEEPVRRRWFSRPGNRPSEKLSIVDDGDQRATTMSSRRITDADDTTPSDNPHQYIELARTEGFFIAAKFVTMGGSNVGETIWILNEPYSGMLLAVVSTETSVIDATLHYNLQTDEAGLLSVPFPEHRDEASKAIYVRETCIDSLRARCRRARGTNALLREWKVTPKISFVTPTEWESLSSYPPNETRGSTGIGELNTARIAELPAGVRGQFHLGDALPGDASA